MKKAYFATLAFLASIGVVTLLFFIFFILQVVPPLDAVQRNISTSFLHSEKVIDVRGASDEGIPSISEDDLLEEYSSITKKYIYLKNQTIEDLKTFDKLNGELNLKRMTILALEKEIKTLNFSITELKKEVKQKVFSNKALVKLNKQILGDFEEISSFLDDLKKSKEQSLFDSNKANSISKLQVNKINFLLSLLEKQVSDNYKLVDSIGKKLDFNLDKGIFQIYKKKKIKFEKKLKTSSISELKKKEMELAFQLKNFQKLNSKLEKFKALPLGWPVINKTRVTSPYGFRKDPINKQRKFHYGIDISGNFSKKIVSTGDGTVVFAGSKGGYGLTITIMHKDNYKSGYSHLNKIFVKTGDILEKGDIIGLMGSTGRSTGVHLHYEIMKRDIKINPRKFLEAI